MSFDGIGPGAWIAVINEARALFLVNKGTRFAPILEVNSEIQAQNTSTNGAPSNRPGRRFDGAHRHRSSMETTDRRALAGRAFAKQVIAHLDELARRDAFRQLLVAAPPPLLHQIRTELTPALRDRLIGDLARDLVNLPIEQLTANLFD